ncbi:hypothetical protein QI633_08190 [Nocardioides sp. QY071]|uniref:hypothetical protein n=1 Tax=Nocardioides sp. QY071 TaxID=3044187 RepID=UPI00249C1D88|nr:hypothetical protein [Nocardioides sp. QY071]WGY03732.1 hypothetical protein QI633_08190 [Nocardioides sp. QY071]
MYPPSEGESAEDDRTNDLELADISDADGVIELVIVVDSSTIIEIKKRVPADQQWDVYDQMLTLVRQGRLAFPSQVKRELAAERHPDMPGPWCARAYRERQHADPIDETLAEILPFIEQVVDANADPDREPADPYVAAMAWELIGRGYDVAVATDDVVDRLPLKISLRSACEGLGIAVWTCDTFVEWVRSTAAESELDDEEIGA